MSQQRALPQKIVAASPSSAARAHTADNYPIYLPDGDFVRFLSRPQPIAAWVAVDGDRVLGHIALNETTSEPVMELVDEHGPPLQLDRVLQPGVRAERDPDGAAR